MLIISVRPEIHRTDQDFEGSGLSQISLCINISDNTPCVNLLGGVESSLQFGAQVLQIDEIGLKNLNIGLVVLCCRFQLEQEDRIHNISAITTSQFDIKSPIQFNIMRKIQTHFIQKQLDIGFVVQKVFSKQLILFVPKSQHGKGVLEVLTIQI